MKSGRFARALTVLAVAATAAAVVFLVQREWFSSDGARAVPEFQVVTTDEEWLELIAEAVRLRSDRNAIWPEPRVQAGTQVLRSCAEIPPAATESQMAIGYSPDGSIKRVVFAYFQAPASSFHLILYSDGDLSGCSDRIKGIVTGPDLHRQAVDQHLCEEMARKAAGLEGTDPTLPPASPRVARAFMEAFCP